MVGCVLARDGVVLGEGFHERFGGPHAEVAALRSVGGEARGATAYVTLEPCCHHGKTPPCTAALLAAGVARVVTAMQDPFPRVAGGGLQVLRDAGVAVEVGLCAAATRELNAPYLHLLASGRPWVIAKWAMTLDGKIATRTGDSKWISGETSRAWVHQLRGRCDAIIVGRGTCEADDPLLTARPSGPRVATRIVLDSLARLRDSSQLVQTAREAPVLVAVSSAAADADLQRLQNAGCETLICGGDSPAERWRFLLEELGRRRMTNVLVEGGAAVLGTAFDTATVDEVHVFVAPKLFGGATAPGPIGGQGIDGVARALAFPEMQSEISGADVHLFGRRRI